MNSISRYFLFLCVLIFGFSASSLEILNPSIEGTYAVSISCPKTSKSCKDQPFRAIDRLTIVDTQSLTGVWIGLASDRLKDYADSFMMAQVTDGGNQLSAVPRTGLYHGRFSYIAVRVDPETGKIEGVLTDNRSTENLVLVGRSIHRLGELYSKARPSGLDGPKLLGRFKGQIGSLRGTLVVKERPDHVLSGSFVSDSRVKDTPLVQLNFYSGSWDASNGVARLVFTVEEITTHQGELALALSPWNRDASVSGFEFIGFTSNECKFTRMMN